MLKKHKSKTKTMKKENGTNNSKSTMFIYIQKNNLKICQQAPDREMDLT